MYEPHGSRAIARSRWPFKSKFPSRSWLCRLNHTLILTLACLVSGLDIELETLGATEKTIMVPLADSELSNLKEGLRHAWDRVESIEI